MKINTMAEAEVLIRSKVEAAIDASIREICDAGAEPTPDEVTAMRTMMLSNAEPTIQRALQRTRLVRAEAALEAEQARMATLDSAEAKRSGQLQ